VTFDEFCGRDLRYRKPDINKNKMETFLDGGLFEVLVALLFATFLNFIFIRKYLLIIFSATIILCPFALLIIHKSELYYWLLSFCLFNSVFLVFLIWKEKKTNTSGQLFDVSALRQKLAGLKDKFVSFFLTTRLKEK